MIAEILAAKMTSVTCDQLGHAAKGASSMMRRDTIERIVSIVPIVDKQNKNLVETHLSHFEYILIEKYFI